jgi:hypothetical protein
MSLARVESAADVQTARVQGVAYVGRQALHAAAMVSETEQQLCRMVPEAAGRLAAIADITSLGSGLVDPPSGNQDLSSSTSP